MSGWGSSSWGLSSWGLSSSPFAASATAGGTSSGEEVLRLLGRDVMFDTDYHVGPDRDWVLVEGLDALKQSLYHRLITKPGEYRLRPSYGCGVLSYVKKRNRPAELAELRQRVVDQLLADRRVDEVIGVTIEPLPDGAQGITVTIAVRASGLELNFTPLSLTDEVTGLSPRT